MADLLGGLLGGLGGGAIGSAIVQLRLDSAAYDKQLAAAEGKTKASAGAMGTSVSKFSALSQTAMLGGAAAFVTFGVAAVRAFSEAQTIIAQTNAVIESTGGVANVTADQVGDLADRLADLAGADDEAVQASINLLLTFRQITDEEGPANTFGRTEQAVLDMATAMNNGAIPAMEQLHNTTILVGKAVNDPIRGMTALTRVGVTFTEAQRDQVAAMTESGDLMGAQAVILRELEAEFGGAAKAAGDTFAGSVGDLSREWGNFEEVVGARLVPVLTSLAEALKPVLFLLEHAGPVVTVLTQTFIYLLSPLLKLVQLLGELGDVLDLGVPITTEMIGLLTQLGVGAATAETQVTAASKGIGDSFENFTKTADKSITEFTDDLGQFREDVIADFDQMAGGLENVSRKWALTAAAAVKATDIIADRQRQIADDLAKLDRINVGDGLKEKLLALGPDMVRAFISGNRNQRQAIRENLKEYDEAARDTANAVQDIAHKGGVDVGDAFTEGAAQGIVAGSSALANAAEKAILNAIAAARRAADAHSASRKMIRLGRELIEGLIEGLESEEDGLVRAAQHAIDAMTREVNKELAVLTREFNKAIGALQDRLSRVQGIAGEFRSSIIGGFSGLGEIFQGLIDQSAINKQAQLDALQSQLDDAQEQGLTTKIAELQALIQEVQEAPLESFRPVGSDITDFASNQVAQAKQFAAILQALRAQGASAALLSQVAGAGPGGIPQAQSLLQLGPEGIASLNDSIQAIADAAGVGAKGLSEDFFGARIDELRDKLSEQTSELREQTRLANELIRLLGNPQRLDVAFRPNADRALRQLFLEVIGELGLSRASL